MLGRLGVADPDAGYMRLVRLTAVFAGIAAVLTAAGIGRVAAHASVDRTGGRRHAVIVAARTHAIASIGLVVIAAIASGHVPAQHARWLWMPLVGAPIGALCGAAIGIACGGAAPLGILDVLALARTPGAKLRHLLQVIDPDDFVKIATALRQRTAQMFHGMFDPAALPPGAPTHDKQPAEPAPHAPAAPPDPPV